MRRRLIIFSLLLILLIGFIFREKETVDVCQTVNCIINESNIFFNDFVHSEGTKIINESGEEIKFRGVNLGGWLMWEGWIWGAGFESETKIRNRLEALVGPEELKRFEKGIYENFITEQDIQEISQMGFNVVRVPVNHTFLEDTDNLIILDNLLSWCEKYNIYVVLTLHSAPGGQANFFTSDPDNVLLWHSEEHVKQTISLWHMFSERYKNRKIIAGYDLLNEPVSNNQQVVELYSALIATVRSTGDPHLVIVEGNDYAKDLSLFEKPLSENILYSFHMYTWFGEDREKQLNELVAITNQQNVPLWAGEFGQNTYEMIDSTITLFEKNNLSGWAFWTWKKVPDKYPYLVGIQTTANWDLVSGYIKSWFGSNKPDRQQAISGMNEFVRSVRYENTMKDQKLNDILKKHLQTPPR